MALQVGLSAWILYHVVVVALIVLDLATGSRRNHGLIFRGAVLRILVWISVGVSFGLFILYFFGLEPSLVYFAAYSVEYTLSLDNLFIFAIIFAYFSTPKETHTFALYAGIIGAIILRAAFIFLGLRLLEIFQSVVFVFAAVLLYSGFRLWRGVEKVHIEDNPIVKLGKRFLPITDQYAGSKFILRPRNKLMFTPLILVLLAIEGTDIVFAFDSVPATLALTRDLFIAYTANISAILGLRSLYSLVARAMSRFAYISKGLAFVLGFLGVKFLLDGVHVEIPSAISIVVVFAILIISIVASALEKPKDLDS